jgi:hypothetical protein
MIGSFSGVVLVAISKVLVKPAEAEIADIPAEDVVIPAENADVVPIEEKANSTYLLGVICGVCAALCFSLLGVATRKL